ncbi:hypothetical protein A8V23_08070 [Yersinia pestis]|nr:hypothetical protein AC471_00495 [Yersinia pestis subsp. microtus bv. Ulegeica]KPD90695.1 hypothetical protein ADT39_06855 [Yersinia pestis subsp. microtus bv. Altaica]KZC73001.1 hypothetical protein AVO28_10760 [Yersinia pestis]PCN64188.1 hypothetical protein A8V21_07865 [Yersinia pestis]PVF38992.1 hypothetical protein A9311_08450 [Yersinia pestis]
MLKKILPVLITLAIVHNTPTAWAAEAPKTDSFYLPKSLDLSPLRLHNIESNLTERILIMLNSLKHWILKQ